MKMNEWKQISCYNFDTRVQRVSSSPRHGGRRRGKRVARLNLKYPTTGNWPRYYHISKGFFTPIIAKYHKIKINKKDQVNPPPFCFPFVFVFLEEFVHGISLDIYFSPMGVGQSIKYDNPPTKCNLEQKVSALAWSSPERKIVHDSHWLSRADHDQSETTKLHYGIPIDTSILSYNPTTSGRTMRLSSPPYTTTGIVIVLTPRSRLTQFSPPSRISEYRSDTGN